jgi:hypothetical protein
MSSARLIDDYVRTLDRRLAGPRRAKRDLLTEARDSLVDATEAYQAAGLDPGDAAARAVAEFGPPGQIASGYQTELAAGIGRRLAVLVAIIPAGAMLFGDQMWKGSSWESTPPPGSYLLIARSLDWITYALGALAILVFLGLRHQARTGGDPRRLCRALGIITIVVLGITAILGNVIYAFTVSLAPTALTWPPMIIGGAVLCVVHATQLIGAIRCLRAVRAASALPALAGSAMPVPAGSRRGIG